MRLSILLRRRSTGFPSQCKSLCGCDRCLWLLKWSLVCSASSSFTIEFRERVWSRPTDSWDHLIMPLPLEYDTWFREKYTARFLFVRCEHSVVIKTDSAIFWEFHPASVVSLSLFFYSRWFYSITCMRHVETDVQMACRVKAPHSHLTFFKRHSVNQFWSNNHSRGRGGRLPSGLVAVHFSSKDCPETFDEKEF